MDVTAIGSFPQVTPAPCAHCGDPCGPGLIVSAGRDFCCLGCEAVFALLHQAGLGGFYSCAPNPGVSQKLTADRQPLRFAVLDDVSVAERFISFNDGMVARVTFTVPNIHCASCVWLLEQLWRFDRGIVRAEVDLLRRAVRVEFRPGATSLRRVAEVLASLGYEPAISPEDAPAAAPSGRRRLQLQIGVAGFAFGNIMLFSIPRYANGAPLEPEFQRLFNLLNVALATPVLIFSAAPYFRAAWESLRARAMAIEVPVALGLMVLFVRSLVDIETGHGEGFLDSFAGLVFFLLLGRLLQHKVFDRIAFDRTYRAFLPLSVRVQQDDGFSLVPLDAVAAGDCIEIRPGEIVPADARLLSADGQVDYAFVTGEEAPVAIRRGAVVRAGGRGVSRTMRLEVVREVSQSHLASLWGNPIFAKPKSRWLTDVGARFGAWFTVGAVALAAAGAVAWWPDAGASARVATAVLIIACPCALTLSAPVTLGTAMGLLGSRGLFLKHPAVALDLSRVDVIAFDKTGTLTSSHDRQVIESAGLDAGGWLLVRELARHSTHPVSRTIASWLDSRSMTEGMTVSGVVEVAGVGIAGWVDGTRVAIGHVDAQGQKADDRTPITVGDERGWVRVVEPIRPGVASAAHALARAHDLHLLSGDQDAARSRWRGVFGSQMRFRQTPQDKLEFIAEKQNDGHHVLMIGDGLNDAGALAAADVGIAVSDETACMVPACDAVIAGDRVADLPVFLRYVRRARSVVLACLLVSAIYNAAGLTLALRGALTPLASAILMPLSSLTVVGLSWGAMQWSARRMLPS